jgi:hypothetical protein
MHCFAVAYALSRSLTMPTPVATATPPSPSPRSAPRLIADTLGMYRRYPLLFLVLAAGVIVPYQLIVLAAAGSFDRSGLSGGVELTLSLVDWLLVGPLVSALHIHAVAEIREGSAPRLGPVAQRGIAALPVVAAASVISALGIAVGFMALIVPGIYLSLRWAVVAQAAAVEGNGWTSALDSSHRLTKGNFGHVFLLILFVALVTWIPLLLLALGVEESTDVGSFLVAVVAQIVILSFTALATALLYYDLRAREEISATPEPAVDSAGGDAP